MGDIDLLPFDEGAAFLSVDDERMLGDVFVLRNTGGEDLVEALFMKVVDLAKDFTGVEGLRVGLELTLEGEGARPLECICELLVEDVVLVVGVRGPGLLWDILCSSGIIDPDNLEPLEAEQDGVLTLWSM